MGTMLRLTAATLVATALFSQSAAADFELGFYGGWNGSFDSDAQFRRGDTNFTMHSVPWEGLSFDFQGGAPYYGARATYWPDASPDWGIMLDYTHAKVRAEGSAKVKTSGTYQGAPAPNKMRVSDAFSRFEFTDGLNMMTLNAVRKLPPLGAARPYVGAGIGLAQPHVEVTGPGFPKTFEYQVTGVAAQVLAGISVPVGRRVSLFGEYKLSYAGVDADLAKGGHLSTSVWTNHLLVGASLRFGGGS